MFKSICKFDYFDVICNILSAPSTDFSLFLQQVEKLELIGMDFIWKIAMESPDEEIANEAIQLIINYSYINLNPRLKKVIILNLFHVQWVELCGT